jgi:hypothetical protein
MGPPQSLVFYISMCIEQILPNIGAISYWPPIGRGGGSAFDRGSLYDKCYPEPNLTYNGACVGCR